MSSGHQDRKKSRQNTLPEGENPRRRTAKMKQQNVPPFGQLDTVHYKAIFDSISDAAILTDSNRRIVSVNPAAEKLWGYSLDEIRGRSTRILYADEDDYEKQGKLRYHPGVKNLLEKYELSYRRKNGEIFYAETMAAKIETDQKDLIGFMVVLRDVTARKKMEEALLHSKKEWERTFDSIADWVSLLDAKSFRILRSNLAGEKLLGLSIKDILGKTCWELVHGTKFPVPECPAPKAVEIKQRATSDIFLADSKRWLRVSVDPVLNKKGEVESLVHVASDITKRKQMEDELRLSREKYQAIFESAGDGIIYIDRNAIVQDINPALSRITGKKLEDIVGRPAAEIAKLLFPGKQGRILIQRIKPLLKGIKLEPIEVEICGRYLEISENVSGSTQGITGIVRDVTERKKAENHIRDTLREKEVLLQEIHHRVKNNMQIISSLLRLQSDSIQDQTIREKFEVSRSRIRSMALIHETLYRSQNFAEVRFSDYIRKLTSHLLAIYADKSAGIKINLDLEDISLDINTAIPCGLIVNELLSNALIHAFPDNKKGAVSVGFYQADNQMIKLTIKDNGVGMVAGKRAEWSGSLGLQLVGDLVKQINGRIMKTRKGGTRFTIVFPKLS